VKPRCLLPALALACGAVLRAGGDVPLVRFVLTVARPSPTAEPAPPEHLAPAQLSAALLAETNRVRAEHGLRPLKPLAALAAAADDQAAFMALSYSLRHDCPVSGQRDAVERVQRHGLMPSTVAENVLFTGFAPLAEPAPSCAELAAGMVAQWMSSPGHRANILNPALTHGGCSARRATFIGGTVGYYSAQVFATP